MYFILQWCDIINKYYKKRKHRNKNKVIPITDVEIPTNNVEPIFKNNEPTFKNNVEPINNVDKLESHYKNTPPPPIIISIKSNNF